MRRAEPKDRTLGDVITSIDGITGVDPDPYEETITSRVYFAIDPDSCQIKIGYTNGSVNKRMNAHRQKRPNLRLLGHIKGTRRLEHALHQRFAAHRRERIEWFSSEIAADILQLLHDEQAAAA